MASFSFIFAQSGCLFGIWLKSLNEQWDSWSGKFLFWGPFHCFTQLFTYAYHLFSFTLNYLAGLFLAMVVFFRDCINRPPWHKFHRSLPFVSIRWRSEDHRARCSVILQEQDWSHEKSLDWSERLCKIFNNRWLNGFRSLGEDSPETLIYLLNLS